MRNMLFTRPWYPVLCLALGIPVAGCPSGDSTGTGDKNYTLNWVFVNQSAQTQYNNVSFLGKDETSKASVRRSVPSNDLASGQTVSIHKSTTTDVTVRLEKADGSFVDDEILVVPVEPDKATTVTAVWDGFDLTVTGSVSSAITWHLVGVTGSFSGNWQDQAATASGVLRFDVVPEEVQPGQTYPVSATFIGSITVSPQWSGYSTGVTVGIVDRGLSGLHVTNSANTGPVTGTASKSVTVTGAWVIPSNATTLAIEAGGGFTMAGTSPNLVATYKKVP